VEVVQKQEAQILDVLKGDPRSFKDGKMKYIIEGRERGVNES